MAQQFIVDFVAELARSIELPEPIVEFGSLQVEPDQPNDLRPLFPGRTFIGTDLRAGPGVDRIEDLRALKFDTGEVGTALCLDTLEHCQDPLAACRELHRVLRDGGMCVLSSVMFFPIHDYPGDYWRFTPEGFRALLEPFTDVWVTGVGHPLLPMHVIGVAAKGPDPRLARARFETVAAAQEAWEQAEGKVRLDIVQMPLKQLARTLAREVPRAVAQRIRARVGGAL